MGARGALFHSIDGLTWEAVDTHVAEDLNAITCSDGNLAAVGNHGTILHSVDGQEWSRRTIASDALLSVYGIERSRKVWAVGVKGTILHTEDGEHWQSQDSKVGTALRSVAGDGTAIWIVGDGGVVLQSADGEHWIKRTGPMADLNSLFVAGNGLWALGGRSTIFHASKSGNDWVSQYEHPSGVLFHLFGDQSGTQIWAIGYQGLILHTGDGAHWTTAVPAVSTKPDLSMLNGGTMSTDGSEAWIVGSEMKILHLAEGGEWRAETEAAQNFLPNAISGSHERRKLFIVGSGLNANALYSSDERAWQPQIVGVPSGTVAAATAYGLASVSMVAGHGDVWAVGSQGRVLHSRDSGETWSAASSEVNSNLESVFATEQGMWAVGDAMVACDNSDHCVPQTGTNSAYLRSISGDPNGKRLWAVGLFGRIMSFDGEKWTILTSPTKENLTSVFATKNGERVFAVGDSGTILRSDNGHDWAILSSPTKANLRSVFFAKDGARGWAVGDFLGVKVRDVPSSESEGTILQTTDGGDHWAEMSVPGLPRAIFGSDDAAELWIVGSTSWYVHSIERPATFLAGAALSGTPDHAQLTLQLRNFVDARSDIHISLSALNDFKYRKHWTPQDFKYKVSRSGNQSDTWIATFDPADLEISSNTTAHFYINVTADRFSQVYEFGALYDPWRWVIDHRVGLSNGAGLITVFATLYLFLFFKPLWILWVYLIFKQTPIDKLFRIPVAGPVLEFVFSVGTFGLPWFVTHKRTLDAWVTAYRDSITEQWARETLPPRASASAQQMTIETTPYVPLPLQVEDQLVREIISHPTADKLSKHFAMQRTVIEVIGPGGAGKTTLARQCGLWSLAGGKPGGLLSHPMIPVWIDEEMGNGRSLPQIVKGKLAALLPEAKLDDSFLAALLEKQRLLIIIDGLSERSAATRQYVEGVYSTSRVEAMLITSRGFLPITGASPTTLFPQALNEVTLLYFMFALLQAPPPAGTSEDMSGEHRAGMSIDDQLALATRLRDLYRESAGADKNILPLPVRFFVGEAKHVLDASQSLDTLPQSIPEIYLRYLEQINPDNPSAPNYMGQTEMIRAAILLAKLALASDFIPKEFDGSDAVDELKKAGWDTQKLDPVQRLLDNGVLTSKGPIASRRLKFVLDPVAEQLAAIGYFRETKHDAAALQAIRDRAQAASGFLRALRLLGKPDAEQPVDVGRVEHASNRPN